MSKDFLIWVSSCNKSTFHPMFWTNTFKKTGIARNANIYLKYGNSTWATIYYLLLKVEALTWPLCSTRQQPQGSRRSGFRHYPFMRRKNERSISREIVRCIGVKHHLLRLWQEEVHHHWPVLAALVFYLGGNNWLSTTFEGQQNYFKCQAVQTTGQICVRSPRTNRHKE